MKRTLLFLVAMSALFTVAAQRHSQQMADSIVKYQMKSGGWPKNQDWLKGPDPNVMRECRRTGIGSTIDNNATVSELRVLAQAVDMVHEIESDGYGFIDTKTLRERHDNYINAFKKGLEFLLEMQYDNGGFPQFYPAKAGDHYSSQITFNDNATVNVLGLLRDVVTDNEAFMRMGIDKSTKKKCKAAYDKGVQCILDCQIRVDEEGRVLEYGTEAWKDGIKTVWCQQHDRKTLAPTKARAYELPSYCGHGETVAIIKFLIDTPFPSEAIDDAVASAVAWLQAHAMKDKAVEKYTNEEGKPDIRIVDKPGSTIWARYYDLETAQPFFCGRDGIPRKNLSDIEYERRNGYQWVGNSPQSVISD